jgi:hypothetical protein
MPVNEMAVKRQSSDKMLPWTRPAVGVAADGALTDVWPVSTDETARGIGQPQGLMNVNRLGFPHTVFSLQRPIGATTYLPDSTLESGP